MRYTTDGTLLLDSGVPIANADYEQTAQRLADALNAAGSASRDAEVARLRGALERLADAVEYAEKLLPLSPDSGVLRQAIAAYRKATA